jgi:phage FluMu protein Com
MHTGYYPRMFGPSLVYVRYRCSRCKKIDEQYVKQEEWENGILKDATVETTEVEKERFTALGPIEMQELVEFHRALEALPNLATLNGEFSAAEADKDGEKE